MLYDIVVADVGMVAPPLLAGLMVFGGSTFSAP